MKIVKQGWQTTVAAGENIYLIKGFFRKRVYLVETKQVTQIKQVKYEQVKV